ncbi:DapH/DapD/GlmU-related protein [Candidatus Accumulibacter sp. ACC003]|uniref:DapH/DapD/GlmU-related protein n=1 Tax=Candidatus Accumulibacter sp. ACC003 TaxID=2823334 RepID=UPI0025BFC84A|nr:DapH/DapD/GlmU-related protein [Candidatus Accumulibacter sp. ACC003]
MERVKLIIYGNGQMARMFLHFARSEFDVLAFTVDRAVLNETEIEGLPVLAFDQLEQQFSPGEHKLITAVGYLEMNELRAQKYAEARARGYQFANYIHPSVVWHANIIAGENNVVLDHVAIHPYTRLGNSNFICSNASIGHGCTIGDNCWINSGVAIGGETRLGDGCFLGLNATIGDNIALAAGCYIGANTLLTRSTQAEEVYISGNGERFPLAAKGFQQFISRTPR